MDNMEIDSRLHILKKNDKYVVFSYGENPLKKHRSEKIDFGNLIRAIRAACGLNQDMFSKFICTSRVTLSQIERTRDVSNISPDMIFRLYYFASVLPKGDNTQGFHAYLYNTLFATISQEITRRQKFAPGDIPSELAVYLDRYGKLYEKDETEFETETEFLSDDRILDENLISDILDQEDLLPLSEPIIVVNGKRNRKKEDKKENKKVKSTVGKSVVDKNVISKEKIAERVL